VIIKTGRFGQLTVTDDEKIRIPQGVLGFPNHHDYCLVDPGDDTLIVWLQSLDSPEIAFPLLEPKIFKQDFSAKLSAAELRELQLENVNSSAVFSILTIPQDVTQMTANLKAPLVINLNAHLAKQIILQENEYDIRHSMFKELRAHLMTIQSQGKRQGANPQVLSRPSEVIPIKNIPPSFTARALTV
jgi:flagellar assembly factor FliW